MKSKWHGLVFKDLTTEEAYKRKQQETASLHFQIVSVLIVIGLAINFSMKINKDTPTIIFFAAGTFCSSIGFLLGNRIKKVAPWLLSCLEIWTISMAFDFSENLGSPKEALPLGISKSLLTFLTVSVSGNWIFKFSVMAISSFALHIKLMLQGVPFNSITALTISVMVIAMGIFFFIEEKSNRQHFLKIYDELLNLRRWKSITEKFIPAGVVVVSGTHPEKNNRKGFNNINELFEIINFNEYFNKFLKINENSGLIKFFRKLSIVSFSLQKEKGLLTNSAVERKNIENLHDLLIKECKSLSQATLNSENNSEDLKRAELTSKLISDDMEGAKEERIFEISLFEFRWKKMPCILIIFNDISERQKNEKLILLDKYKDLLLASVSHELKTPLNSIMGVTSLLLSRPVEAEVRTLLDQIKTSGEFLLSEINDLLDYSLISNGKLRLNILPFSVCEIIAQIQSLFELSFKQKGLDLIVDYSAGPEIKLSTDFMRLKQVLINLVGNALKFTFQGSITIKIEESSQYVEFSVIDTGCGMRSEIVRNLFQVFGTFDETKSKANSHGVGLGLMISKQIVGKLGPEEKIHVESELGVGSKFNFRIFRDLSQNLNRKADKIAESSITSASRRKSLSPKLIDLYPPILSPLPSRSKEKTSTKSSFSKMKKAKSKSCLSLNLFKRSLSVNKISSMLLSTSPTVECLTTSRKLGKKELGLNTKEQRISEEEKLEDLSLEECFEEEIIRGPYESKPVKGSLILRDFFSMASFKQKLNEEKASHVLIVDDTPFNILIIENFLKSFKERKFYFERAFSGLECLEKVESKWRQGAQYDVILMDCNMPILDGFEASLKLRKLMNTKQIPKCYIFGISAYSGEHVLEQCLSSGMDDFLPKPITQEKFRSFLLKWI